MWTVTVAVFQMIWGYKLHLLDETVAKTEKSLWDELPTNATNLHKR